jgi:uncharacterized protein
MLIQRTLICIASLNLGSFLNAEPIHDAVKAGDTAKVQSIVNSDSKALDAINDDGFTPLMLAARNDRPDVAKFLLGKGAAINAQSAQGYTALMIAVMNNHENLVRILLDRGADVFLQSNDGEPRSDGRPNSITIISLNYFHKSRTT